MHIDWFIFFAQMVNFLILVYLLKRFLFGRIIAAMDKREAGIAATLSDADRMKQEAFETAEACTEKNRMWNERYEGMVKQAAEEVEVQRKELMNKARSDVDQIRRRWEETIDREKDAFLQHIRQWTGKHIYTVARKALQDLADVDLERRIVDVFIRRLEGVSEQESTAIRESVRSADGSIIVQSAFDISPELRERLQAALLAYGADGKKIQYVRATDVVSGIELRTAGYKLAWSLNEYLESLEESLSSALQEEAKR
jgi:F-type H+-transporting ATPase subunit b